MNKNLNEKVDEIAKMYFEELKPLRQIGEQLGVSAMAIRKLLTRHGFNTSKENLKLNVVCEYCEKAFKKFRFRVRETINNFCSKECYHSHLKLINEGNVIDRYGQIISRIKMSKIYGELPEKSIVHHIDGNDTNTSITNLMLLESQADHIKIHRNYGNPKILFDGSKLRELWPNLSDFEIESRYF